MAKKTAKTTATFQKNEKINRIFSEQFKREKVALIMQKKLTIKQCSELYDVTTTTVYKCLYQYSPDYGKGTKMVVQLDSEARRTLALQERSTSTRLCSSSGQDLQRRALAFVSGHNPKSI